MFRGIIIGVVLVGLFWAMGYINVSGTGKATQTIDNWISASPTPQAMDQEK